MARFVLNAMQMVGVKHVHQERCVLCVLRVFTYRVGNVYHVIHGVKHATQILHVRVVPKDLE